MMPADGMIPLHASVEATTAIAVGPEGLYLPIAHALASASATVDLSLYTFEHPQMAQVLVDAAGRGVRVRLLLEGGPAGGISDLQKWCVSRLVDAGAEVRYMAPLPDAPNGYRTRYNFLHAKYAVIDGNRAFNGSENFTRDAMPAHSGEVVGGRRGFYLFTDATPVVVELATLFAHDWDADHFLDLFPYDAEHSKYGAPPSDFVMPEPSVYEEIESSPFGNAVSTFASSSFSLVSTPENALFPNAGLMDLLRQAGAGDKILAWQLYEHAHWGDTASNAVADPNPRLQAIVDAARRGARVRLLLDAYFDSGNGLRSNQVTRDYLHGLAATEGLDIQVRLGNPTGGGIHAKVILVSLSNERWSAVGSLNGSEVSHKLNREVVVLTDAPPIYKRLTEVFEWDWALSE
jgi:cardiolipin synthase